MVGSALIARFSCGTYSPSRVAREPLIVGEQPDIDAELVKHIEAALRRVRRDQMLLDRLQLRIDDRAAVERRRSAA